MIGNEKIKHNQTRRKVPTVSPTETHVWDTSVSSMPLRSAQRPLERTEFSDHTSKNSEKYSHRRTLFRSVFSGFRPVFRKSVHTCVNPDTFFGGLGREAVRTSGFGPETDDLLGKRESKKAFIINDVTPVTPSVTPKIFVSDGLSPYYYYYYYLTVTLLPCYPLNVYPAISNFFKKNCSYLGEHFLSCFLIIYIYTLFRGNR